MNNLHKFRKLTVWQRSVTFVTLIYKITSKFPKDERFGLIDPINLKMTDKSILDDTIIEVDQLSAMLTGLIKSLKADS